FSSPLMTGTAAGLVVRRSERIIDCPVRTIVRTAGCAERAATKAAGTTTSRRCFIDTVVLRRTFCDNACGHVGGASTALGQIDAGPGIHTERLGACVAGRRADAPGSPPRGEGVLRRRRVRRGPRHARGPAHDDRYGRAREIPRALPPGARAHGGSRTGP